MTIYAAFNEVDTMSPDAGLTTNSTVAVAGVNRAGFYVPSGGSAAAPLTEAITEGWYHIRTRTYCQTNYPYTFASVDNGVVSCFTLSQQGNEYIRISITAGGGTTYNSTTYSLGTAHNVDVHFKIGSPGFVKFYLDGILQANHVGNIVMTSGNQNVNRLYFGPAYNDGRICLLSHAIVSDESTIDARVHTLATTTTADTDWTGTVANITGTGYATLGNSIRADTTGKILQLSHSMPAIQSYERIAAVCFSASGISEDATEGYQVDMLTKHGGNYTALEDPATLNQSTWTEKQWIMHTHPETAAAWDVASINATTVGLLSGFAP